VQNPDHTPFVVAKYYVRGVSGK